MQNSAIYRLFDIHTNDIIIQMLDIPIWLNYFCKLHFLFYSNKTKPQDIFSFFVIKSVYQLSCEQKTYVEISHSVSKKHKNMIFDGWIILTFFLILGKPCQKNHIIWSNFLIAHWIDSHNGATKNRILSWLFYRRFNYEQLNLNHFINSIWFNLIVKVINWTNYCCTVAIR